MLVLIDSIVIFNYTFLIMAGLFIFFLVGVIYLIYKIFTKKKRAAEPNTLKHFGKDYMK